MHIKDHQRQLYIASRWVLEFQQKKSKISFKKNKKLIIAFNSCCNGISSPPIQVYSIWTLQLPSWNTKNEKKKVYKMNNMNLQTCSIESASATDRMVLSRRNSNRLFAGKFQ